MKLPGLPLLLALCPLVPAPAARADLPPRITVQCGEVTLLLRAASQWTPGRIDFRGTPLTTERSAYGTVFSFPGVGFIGTGHHENEPEDLGRLAFFLDGKALEAPGETLAGDRFRFERESRIRTLRLRSVVELKGGRLLESAWLRAEEDTPQKLLYHFMHAWVPTVSAFLAGKDSSPGEIVEGTLGDSEEEARGFRIGERVDWVALYEPTSRKFAVSRLLEAPDAGGHVSLIWNVPGTYRKYYLRCFADDTVPAGFEGLWRMATAFGAADEGEWRDAARKLAAELREAP